MTFTDDDLDRVKRYLGFPLIGSTPVIQPKLDAIAAEGTAAVNRVKAYLKELDRIDNEINDTRPFAGRSFQTGASGSTQFFQGERMGESRREGWRYVKELAIALDLRPLRNIFDGGGDLSGPTVRG